MCKQILIILFLCVPHFSFAQSGINKNIGERTLQFDDVKRNRPIITEIWYPTTDTLKANDKRFSPFVRQYTVRNGRLPAKRLPLIMFSHGTGGGRLTLEWLAQELVKNGFIVAAVDHWGNTMDNKIPIEFLKTWERPQDISFALTKLLNDKEFKMVIDTQKIGATGFSLGGYTVIALAGGKADYQRMLKYYRTVGRSEVVSPELPGLEYLLDDTTLDEQIKHIPKLKDGRIKAFFAIFPGSGPGFVSKQQFADVHDAVYIIGSQADSLAPIKKNAKVYHDLIFGSRYYEFPGSVGHYVMLAQVNEELKKEAPGYFIDDASVNRRDIHIKVADLAVNFFKETLNF